MFVHPISPQFDSPIDPNNLKRVYWTESYPRIKADYTQQILQEISETKFEHAWRTVCLQPAGIYTA